MNGCDADATEESLLLAYYFGKHKILNCVAVMHITRALIHSFESPAYNRSTKYSGHIDGCCVCHEKEVIYKKLLKQYYQSSTDGKQTEESNTDVEEAWESLVRLWNNAGIVLEGNPAENACIDEEKYTKDCADLLKKHRINLADESKWHESIEKWKKLLLSIKSGLKECLQCISRINSGKLDATPLASQCPNFSKTRLRNVYLTLIISKGARIQAKFLQDCRKVGIQIRAARDPIAVVAKYMICGKCLHKQKRHQIVTIPEILKNSHFELSTDAKFDEAPGIAEKLCTGKNRLICNELRIAQPGVKLKIPRFSSKLAVIDSTSSGKTPVSHCPKTESVLHYVKNASSRGASVLVKQRLSLPSKLDQKVPIHQITSDSAKEALSVVIVTPEGQATSSSVSALPPNPFDTVKPNANAAGQSLSQPVGLHSVKVISGLGAIRTVPTSTSSIVLTSEKQSVWHPKIATLQNNMLRTRNITRNGNRNRPILLRTMKPVSIVEMKNGASSQPTVKKSNGKPFVVQIIDGKLKKHSPAKQQICRTIPLSSNQIKLVKAVSLKNPCSSENSKSPGTIFVKSLKLPSIGDGHGAFNGSNIKTVTFDATKLKPVCQEKGKTDDVTSSNFGDSSSKSIHAICTVVGSDSSYGRVSSKSETKNTAASTASKRMNFSSIPSASRTPSKKRSKQSFPSKPISAVVAEYIFSLMPSADKDLWRKVQTRNKRRWEKSSSMIPVPYETNFLCIHDTIEQYGWKAYWYRKCRCSKIRDKTVGVDSHADHNKANLNEWIPESLTDEMRKEFTSSFEREDTHAISVSGTVCTSRETGECSKRCTQSPAKTSSHHKTEMQIPKLKLEFESSEDLPLSPKRLKLTEVSAVKLTKKECDSTLAVGRSLKSSQSALKAKYRKDKNGRWVALGKETEEIGVVMSNRNEDLSKEMSCSSGKFVGSSNLDPNYRSGLSQVPMKVAIKDVIGSTREHGLRRCARAAMIRRKVLVNRAVKLEQNSKLKKEKSEMRILQNFVFSSCCDSSKLRQKFTVVMTQPTCFKNDPDLCIRLEARRKEKLEEVHAAYKDYKPKHEMESCQIPDDHLVSNILQSTPLAGTHEKNNGREIKDPSSKKRKCKLLDDLEVIWDGNDDNNVVSHSAKPKSRKKARSSKECHIIMKQELSNWKRKVVQQITSEKVCDSLQTLRKIPVSAPVTNVISAKNAEFIVTALKLVNIEKTEHTTADAVKERAVDIVSVMHDNDALAHSSMSISTEKLAALSRDWAARMGKLRIMSHPLNKSTLTNSSSGHTGKNKQVLPRLCCRPQDEGLKEKSTLHQPSLNQTALSRDVFPGGGHVQLATSNNLFNSVPAAHAIFCELEHMRKTKKFSYAPFVDTSNFNPNNLRAELRKRIVENQKLSRVLNYHSKLGTRSRFSKILKQWKKYLPSQTKSNLSHSATKSYTVSSTGQRSYPSTSAKFHCEDSVANNLLPNMEATHSKPLQGNRHFWKYVSTNCQDKVANLSVGRKRRIRRDLAFSERDIKAIDTQLIEQGNSAAQWLECHTKRNNFGGNPISTLLCAHLDVKTVHTCMWESTSATAMGLHADSPVKKPCGRLRTNDLMCADDAENKESEITDLVGKTDAPGKREHLCTVTTPDTKNMLCKYCNLLLIKHKYSPDEKPPYRRPKGISKSKLSTQLDDKRKEKETFETSLDDKIDTHGESMRNRNIFRSEVATLREEGENLESDFLMDQQLRQSKREHNDVKLQTSMQALRETLFAELQSRNSRCGGNVSLRFSKEGGAGDWTGSDHRKLNRFTTNGCFIRRLLESDAEHLVSSDAM